MIWEPGRDKHWEEVASDRRVAEPKPIDEALRLIIVFVVAAILQGEEKMGKRKRRCAKLFGYFSLLKRILSRPKFEVSFDQPVV